MLKDDDGDDSMCFCVPQVTADLESEKLLYSLDSDPALDTKPNGVNCMVIKGPIANLGRQKKSCLKNESATISFQNSIFASNGEMPIPTGTLGMKALVFLCFLLSFGLSALVFPVNMMIRLGLACLAGYLFYWFQNKVWKYLINFFLATVNVTGI